MLKTCALVGNPRKGSRTSTVAEAVVSRCETALLADGERAERVTVELAELAGSLFDAQAPEVTEALGAVAGAELAVVASPTFKASYTGLLKSFLDRYGDDGLAGVVAVPVMVGNRADHALAPEVGLRPLLVELGASVPTRGLYLAEASLASLDELVGAWGERAFPILAGALGRSSERGRRSGT